VTLYDQLGGEPALQAAVEEFYTRMQLDPEVATWFVDIDIAQLKQHQRAFLAVGLGGPEHYTGRSMRNAHAHLHITPEVFTRAVDHLAESLAALGVAEPIVAKVVRRIETMRVAIVESQ
jgi:hemoglobin